MGSLAAKGICEVEGGGQTHAKCGQGFISVALLDTNMQNTVSGIRLTPPSASVFPMYFKWHPVAVDTPPQSNWLIWCPYTTSQFLKLVSTASCNCA